MKRLIFALTLLFAAQVIKAYVPIMGEPEADVERMYQYVAARNPNFQREVAEAFHELGLVYGIRGDIALCQAIVETGWFKFDNGTHVPPDAHNYCGLGVGRRGDKGCRFASVREGVTAMMQHLFAYCTTNSLPEGERLVDPRFTYVRRGCAPTWDSLSGRWAMSADYGQKILKIHAAMMRHKVVEAEKGPAQSDTAIEEEIFKELLLRNETDRNNQQYSLPAGNQ